MLATNIHYERNLAKETKKESKIKGKKHLSFNSRDIIKLTKKNGITLEVRLYLKESMEFNI